MKALLFAQPYSILAHPHPWPPPRFSIHCRLFSTKYRPWDSNTETVRSQKFNSNFTRKDDDPEEEEESDADDEDEDFETGFGSRRKKRRRWWSDESEFEQGPAGTFEDAIDAFWIFKVFKSYGWTLPPIIISLLLSTGPKAFLMALALPLAQSILSLALEKLSGRTGTRRKRRSKKRKNPFGNSASKAAKADEPDEIQEDRKGKTGYQSWVNNGSVDKGGKEERSFGGWDDLDRVGSMRRQSGTGSRNQRATMRSSKLSRRERRNDTPLLLRLLIAVFPFLGSWTKIL